MTPYEQLLALWALKKIKLAWSPDAISLGSQEAEYRLTIFTDRTQILQAGCARPVTASLIPELRKRIMDFHEDEIVHVSLGDGTSSEGRVLGGTLTACNLKFPVLSSLKTMVMPSAFRRSANCRWRRFQAGENFPNLYLAAAWMEQTSRNLEVMQRSKILS